MPKRGTQRLEGTDFNGRFGEKEIDERSKELKVKQLTNLQKMVAYELAYAQFTGKTEGQIADEYNIARTTVWRWKGLPQFNAEINTVALEIQKSKQLDIFRALDKCLTSENEKTILKAIELLSRQLGLFKDSVDQNINVSSKKSLEDILKEVDDL
ncbi:phBC6A51 family helix-turn-helix protein [Clostridium felsineum]|uniref:phBC6A51 family helix-turn-helix protein n=1 Tax=Clostridium felsineum TaxID=36839 RepID=UPI00098C1AF4|nr:phBC6A51 family helix-turn-helix protein [Clostridium felsineum]URZ16875.1 hypothetical protein CLFE_029220 [Clostridium felsineum DSM 794]